MTAIEVAVRVVDSLNSTDIPYVLVGSFSSNYRGIPRSTNDADFVVPLNPGEMTKLWTLFERDFDLDPRLAYLERWRREHGTLERLGGMRRSIPPI